MTAPTCRLAGALRMAGPILLLGLLAAAGCASIGPDTIARDRFDYNTAVADSWKRQLLLNIVKIRYGDAPIFLDVVSITNQYSFESELAGTLGWSFPPGANWQEVGGTGRYYDRPTITYTPLSGEKFARNLMTPVPPDTVMALVEGGYPIEQVFRLMVHSVNGIRNQFGGAARMRRADPEFRPLLANLREVQASGAVTMRVKKIGPQAALVMVFSKASSPELTKRMREIRHALNLREGDGEFRVVYGSAAASDSEIALMTRSVFEVLSDISSTVEVPADHVADRRVAPAMPVEWKDFDRPLIRIGAATERPADAFVAVPYRDAWFWIDDRDFASKGVFSFMLFIMALTESGGKDSAPVLTISAGG
ncbi:MAG: hypothetical protein AB7D27_09865 [Desulfomicrobium sp.]